MSKIGTFWTILLTTVGGGLFILILDRIFGEKTNPLYFALYLIMFELAVGFECVVKAIKRED
jgi:hypothetical protein